MPAAAQQPYLLMSPAVHQVSIRGDSVHPTPRSARLQRDLRNALEFLHRNSFVKSAATRLQWQQRLLPTSQMPSRKHWSFVKLSVRE